jgi:hypothetical protein
MLMAQATTRSHQIVCQWYHEPRQVASSPRNVRLHAVLREMQTAAAKKQPPMNQLETEQARWVSRRLAGCLDRHTDDSR